MTIRFRLPATIFILRQIVGLFAILFVLASVVQANAQILVGTPLNSQRNFELGDDLGFGHRYSPSLGENYQDWGVQRVTKSDGFPVRLGDRSIRFETREGFCGWDDGWSDCTNGRSRHELSTSGDRDPSDATLWYALSLFIPEEFDSPRSVGSTLFQFWSGGLDSWSFKYDTGIGFHLQRKLDNADTLLVADASAKGRWIDILLRTRHSLNDTGSMTVWADGELVYDYSGRTSHGDDSSAPNYFKFGIYNTAFGPDFAPVDGASHGDGEGLPDLHLFFDEIRFGRTCEALSLADLNYDCDKFSYEGADRKEVMALQSALNALGCEVGAVDGIVGRRTVEEALNCRRFGPGELPDTVSVSSIPQLAALYTDAAAQGMAEQERVTIVDALSEIVGGNGDNALSLLARADELELDFILIGHFSESGTTDWLSILLKDNLSAGEAEAALECPRVNIQTWGDGSNHAEIQFQRSTTTSWVAHGASCLERNLPTGTDEELIYLLGNFQTVARELVFDGYTGEVHTGLSRFIDMAAAGEVVLSGQ